VKVVDESGMPLEGVNRIPQHLYGRGSRLSDANGFIYVQNYYYFSLTKAGYKTVWVDVGVEGLSADEVFVMKTETRSAEEARKDDLSNSDALWKKNRPVKDGSSNPP
jgi:hypothetical protein